jgi:hypothetical protein
MRSFVAVSLASCLFVLAAVSCGESDGGGDGGNAAGRASGGEQPGTGGEPIAGTGGSATAGAATGSAGSASGGNGAGGNGAGGAGSAGSPASGGDSSDAGEPSSGGGGNSDGFVDCDTRKVMCKIAVPECPLNEAPSVVGTCYGPCVRIDHCACETAAECPNPNEYTCWMQQHCGPFVK